MQFLANKNVPLDVVEAFATNATMWPGFAPMRQEVTIPIFSTAQLPRIAFF